MPITRWITVAMLVSLPVTAWAQIPLFSSAGESSHTPIGVAPSQSLPARPLVVGESVSSAYLGLDTSLGDGTAFDVWSLPLGVGFGLAPGVEAGLDLLWVMRPFNAGTFLGMARPYLRTVVIEELLALEAALYVPTLFVGALGFEVQAPVHYRLDPVELIGCGSLQYGLSSGVSPPSMELETQHAFAFSLAGTALYDVGAQLGIAPGLFAVGDLTYAFLSLPFTPRYNDQRLSLGLGVGYRVLEDTIVKGTFFFTDLASSSPAGYSGLDGRGAQIVVVQGFSLSR